MVLGPRFVWMNGKFVPFENANVHVMTHALHYGSAVFEGIRAYKTKSGAAIFRLDEHVERLFFSAKSLGMKINFSKDDIRSAIIGIVRKNKLSDAYIRPLIYYGYGNVGVYPKDIKTDIAIAAVSSYAKAPRRLKVYVSKFRKHSKDSIVPMAKISGNYVNSILAMNDARSKGHDEALMLDNEGLVAEGPTENILIVKNGVVISPVSSSVLYGITIDAIKHICKDLDIKFTEREVKLNDLLNADEAFFCGTGREISYITSINGRKINTGKIAGIVSKKYFDIVKGKNSKYRKWLTFV